MESASPIPSDLPWSDAEVDALRRGILEFFEARARPLPWRGPSDPYRILVSEVMSQQTRLETVVPYYRRWVERFPDTAALAAADLDEVLSMWAGLGYYSRARNLHRAARELEARYGGRVPADPRELRTLPGVGPYTAGAVASIAHGVAAPAVDGNVRRVMARLLDEPRPGPKRLERAAGALVDPGRPGDFNQGLMELGSLVCTPRDPACMECPLQDHCAARAAGTQRERPAPRRQRTAPRVEEGVAVLARPDGALLLRRRPSEGLLAGMWEFPGARLEEGESPRAAAARAAAAMAASAGHGRGRERAHGTAVAGCAGPLPPVRHAFSHLEVTYHPWLTVLPAGPAPEEDEGEGGRWVGQGERARLPLPVAQRRILRAAEAALAATAR